MKRGEIWTLRDDRFAAKARPVVVVGSDDVQFSSVILCLLTSLQCDDVITRPSIEPTAANGLNNVSSVMTDKIVTVRAEELGQRVGKLTRSQMRQVSRGLAKVLGIAADDLAD